MIVSMTGISRHNVSEEGYIVTCEVKSLNSKYLDLNVKLPRKVNICEEEIRSLVRSKCRRGRIDLFVNVEAVEKPRNIPSIDPNAFRMYWNELVFLSKIIPDLQHPTISDVLSIPYIFSAPTMESLEDLEKEEKLLCSIVLKACEEALEKLGAMKRREGELLEAVCQKHLSIIESILNSIESRKSEVLLAMRDRMRERVSQLLADLSVKVDEHLILQEIAILADRTDISEELARLRAHVNHFRTIAFSNSTPADGKQLDFIVQEMHREANTIGSKSADLAISEFVVTLKTEIAKLREQVQNIE
ncbi:MAG: YicC/YloC family endoribonuclease [Thermodesulforhabdaceae bacterium]